MLNLNGSNVENTNYIHTLINKGSFINLTHEALQWGDKG